MVRITKRNVDALKPSQGLTASGSKKDTYLWDSGEGSIAGFGCKCTPAGRRVFLFQYRNDKGVTKRVTIGAYSEALTPDQARGLARSIAGQVQQGNDPASDKRKKVERLTLGEVRDRFVSEHVEAKLKGRSQVEYKRALRTRIDAKLCKRPIEEIRRADISKLHHDMREKPIAANRTVAVLSKMFSWAEEQELRPEGSNPCRHVERFAEKPRERYLTDAELRELGKALKITNANPLAVAAVRLLLFTGARLNEILSLRWSTIDIERGTARLADSKTGAKTLHLSPPALEVLSGLKRVDGNPYVLPATRGQGHYIGIQKPWRAIRKTAGIDDVRIHDLRHSFASVGAIGGTSIPILGALLGHTHSSTTDRYSHLSQTPLSAASAAIGYRIAAAMGVEDLDDHTVTNVVSIEGRN